MNKSGFFLLACLLLPLGQAFCQEAEGAAAPGARVTDAEERLRIATTSEDYPVTPGDQYRLTYRQNDAVVANIVLVEADYSVNLGVFGTMDAAGMSFPQFQLAVKKLILSGYPRSLPSLTPSSLGAFRVFVKGEVPRARYVTAWGLSRVSDILENMTGPDASLRAVQVVSKGGKTAVCDLFRAISQGAKEEDPYVKPGDTIILARNDRTVEITGEIRKPGKYQLLQKDPLSQLIQTYGGGFTAEANRKRARIERTAGGKAVTQYIDLAVASETAAVLQDGDKVVITSLTATLPTVTFEGALVAEVAGSPASAPAAGDSGAGTGGYRLIERTFRDGEMLSDAVRSIRKSIASNALLPEATLIRRGESAPVPVDLSLLLASDASPGDVALKPFDRIVIPGRVFSVMVNGPVVNPGSYPYSPDQGYAHYISLSGGVTTEAGSEYGIAILDRKRNARDKVYPIQAEDTIQVIPGRVFSVMVNGAVVNPQSYPYLADQRYRYYLSLAGGVSSEAGSDYEVVITDADGKARRKEDPVQPDDAIRVVPGRILTVMVNGAVVKPQSYPYLTNQRYRYYVSLAGGVVAEAGTDYDVAVSDMAGNARGREDPIQPEDTVQVIPGRAFTVAVNGAVVTPGNYPYSPNRRYRYYLSLAGGVSLTAGTDHEVAISDIDGHTRNTEDTIQPEDVIQVIPGRVPSVMVNGAVVNSRSYPYTPNQRYMYYILLAGGVSPEAVSGYEVSVLDREGNTRSKELPVLPDDTIQVTDRFVSVSVTGAVNKPGNHPYALNREFRYYLSLAGGVSPEAAAGYEITVVDREGNTRSRDKPVLPDDTIQVTGRFVSVSVNGAVVNPRNYPYAPDRQYRYYLSLAGGVSPAAGVDYEVAISDMDGKARGQEDPIQPEDIIQVIPGRVSSVMVNGAVVSPRSYPYSPNRKYMYYLSLAGGVTPEASAGYEVAVLDQEGNERSKDQPVQPDDTIQVTNRFISVSVNGAITKPGSYPYSPNRQFRYYIALAGGVSPEASGGYEVSIVDKDGKSRQIEEPLQPEDMVQVNSRSVNVLGAVFFPKAYPYISGQTYRYYANLAGGIDPERNLFDAVTITGRDGSLRKPEDVIQPFDRIYFHTNSFSTTIAPYLPLVSTVIGIVTTVLSVLTYLAEYPLQ